jgi:ribonuclease HI
MTNNEAEYHAALLGLAMAAGLGARRVEIATDSDVVVRQMRGLSRVLSPRLQGLHREVSAATQRFEEASFRHVPREKNRLADALAAEALVGRTVSMDIDAGRWRRFRRQMVERLSTSADN